MTLVLSGRTSPLTVEGTRGCFAVELGRCVMVGASSGARVATSDDNGLTWTGRGVSETLFDVVWAPTLPLFVAVADTSVYTSPDGITWTARSIGPYFGGGAIAWSPSLGRFVLGGVGYSASYGHPPNNAVWTSPDGITWTGRGVPPGFTDVISGIAWSPTLNLFAAIDAQGNVATSPNGIAWTGRTGHMALGRSMRWLPTAAKFVAVGVAAPTTGNIATSPDGITWTANTSGPWLSGFYQSGYDICEFGSSWFAGGVTPPRMIYESKDQGASWTPGFTADDGNITGSRVSGIFAVGTSTVIAGAGSGATSFRIMSGAPIQTAPPVRFYQGYDWRWIVTTLEGRTLTFLDPLAMNRQIVFQLNDMAIATCDLPSDNPEVNIISGDLDPFVNNANRLLYAFRREQPGTADPWVCKFAGVIEELNDEINANIDAPVTHLTAYDPWHYLDSMPVVDNIYAQKQTGQGGVTYPANGNWTAASVVVDVVGQASLFNFLESSINPMPLGPTYCYVDFKTGHVPPHVADPTPPLTASVNFQPGMTVGDALRQMTTDGLCDITFTPIYPMITDPTNPSVGALCKLNVYQLAGSAKNDAVMAWDMPGNSLVGLNRLESASTMGNHAMLSAGTAGALVVAAPDAQSTQKYGPYWYIDSVSGKVAYPEIVRILAQAQVLQRAYGQPTFALDPAPERSPIPLLDYNLGDSLPIYTSSRFREQIAPVIDITATHWEGLGRVWTIPISMPDDAPETVVQMVVQVFPVPPHSIFAPIEAHITTALAAARRPIMRGAQTQQRAARRLQTFYGHLSGYGYGT